MNLHQEPGRFYIVLHHFAGVTEKMSGKRKRENVVMQQGDLREATEGQLDHQQVFRQYFESRFEPLLDGEVPTSNLAEESEVDDGDSGGSEWQGFSEDDHYSSPVVEVIEHGKPNITDDSEVVRRSEAKSFMVSPQLLMCLSLAHHPSEL